MGQRSLYLTEEADRIYQIWRAHGLSASRKVSRAIVRLFEPEEIVPALQPGELRTSVTGQTMVWTTEGWKVEEE